MTYKPYTYLVKHIPSGKFYYGVRYAKNCHPSDFFKTYFTSSNIIKKLIKEGNVNDFEYEIRKTFSSKEKAIKWECRVLKFLNVVKREDFLNRTDNKIIAIGSGKENHQYGKKNNKFKSYINNLSSEEKKKIILKSRLSRNILYKNRYIEKIKTFDGNHHNSLLRRRGEKYLSDIFWKENNILSNDERKIITKFINNYNKLNYPKNRKSPPCSAIKKKKISKKRKGKNWYYNILTLENKFLLNPPKNNSLWIKGMHKKSNGLKNRKLPKETKIKQSQTRQKLKYKCIHKDGKRKYVSEWEIKEYLNNGYKLGQPKNNKNNKT